MAKKSRSARAEITKLAKQVRLVITIIGAVLAALFTWLQIKDVPFATVVESTKPEFVQRAALILYYLSWIGGGRFDVSVQEKVYADDPQRGQFAILTIFVIVAFAVVAVALFWASGDERKFTLVLTAFVAMNFVGWRHIVSRVGPIVTASRRRYRDENDFIGLEQLQLVSDYMMGRWQMYRFAVMGGILAFSDLVSLVAPVRPLIGDAVARLLPQVQATTIAALLPEIVLLMFVLVAEGWIWMMRIRVAISLRIIDVLSKKYDLLPRKAQQSVRSQ